MAEQPGEIRRIDWDELFPFIRIFRSFRMAIQPGRLGLALAGVICMGLWGGLLDFLWGARPSIRPIGPEAWVYWQVPDIHAWRGAYAAKRLDLLLSLYGPDGPLKDQPHPAFDDPKAANKAMAQLRTKLRALRTGDQTASLLTRQYIQSTYNNVAVYRSRGVFGSFLEYEQQAVNHFLDEGRRILALDWLAVTRGTNEVINARYATSTIRPPGEFGDIGLIGTLMLMLRGWQWMVTQHLIFALLFGLGSLAIWSLFGGAISRMAALNVARDEQISPQAALGFASRKFLALFSAPMLPLLMVAGIGVLLWLGGFLVLQIPYIGELIGGVLMILALLGGFVMTLVLAGAIGGGSLLWPTIAVEGSDGFDAMARSYNYFYARPWRLGFYAIVATVHAGLTYIVLRYFVFFMFRLTRYFVGAGAGVFTSRPGTGQPGAGKLEAMWATPRPDHLLGQWNTVSLGQIHLEGVGSVLIYFWLVLIVLTLCEFLVSYFFSATTIIYTLLRNKVDATDFEDVFVEEDEESLAAVPAASGAAVDPTMLPPADPAGS